MNAKLAELLSQESVNFDLGGNGVLPSICLKCKGVLDFTRIVKNGKKVLVLECRDCGNIVELD